MPNISFFTHTINPHIIRKHIAFMELNTIHHIELICPTTEFRSDTIYIGIAADVADLLRLRQPEIPITIFSSDDIYRLDIFMKWKNLNLITTSWSLAELYNQVNTIWNYYYHWNYAMASALCHNQSLQDIIISAGKMMHGYVFLLNPGYTCICHSQACDDTDPFADEILKLGYLQYENVQLLNHHLLQTCCFRNSIRRFTLEQTRNGYYVMPIYFEQVLLAHLMLIINENYQHTDLFEMLQTLGSLVKRKLTENGAQPQTTNTAFFSIFEDYAQQQTLNEFEVRNRFQLFPVPVKKYMQCLIVQFKNTFEKQTADFLLHQLTELLPPCNFTIYQEHIIFLYSSDQPFKSAETYVDMQKLSELLLEFQACAIFSAVSRFPERFYTLFTLSKKLLNILTHLNLRTTYPDIYIYDEYFIYLSIDLAAQQFQTDLHHSEIIYLADSSVITLARYDTEHHSDLLDLLFYYLLNGCNVTRTAKMMYMHRNTVLNKVNKINTLIKLPLDNGSTQQRLLFSCQLVKYYQEYLRIQLHL